MGHRIGIVGCGGIARAHVEGYRAVLGEETRVVAACDTSPDTLNGFCDAYGVPMRFSRARELIESGEVDVISLLTPPQTRADVIHPATEHGIHLLVEKPFAENVRDAIAFAEAAEKAGTVLAVNQQLRFMPDIATIRDVIARGDIGDIRFIAHDQYQNRTDVRGWRAHEERLEISIFSIHLLDRIRWLMGRPPESVSASTRHWNATTRGETFAALTIRFAGDVVGTMVSNWHSLALSECRLRVDGTEGSLLSVKATIVSDLYTLTVQRLGGNAERLDGSRPNSFRNAMGESMQRLLHAVDTGTPPPHSGRDNVETMAIVDAAYRSAEADGERVDIADVLV